MDESLSNLTSASGEIIASSGNRIETPGTMYLQQSSFPSTNQAPPPKKKRNLPGNPGLKFTPNCKLFVFFSLISIYHLGFHFYWVSKQTQMQK